MIKTVTTNTTDPTMMSVSEKKKNQIKVNLEAQILLAGRHGPILYPPAFLKSISSTFPTMLRLRKSLRDLICLRETDSEWLGHSLGATQCS